MPIPYDDQQQLTRVVTLVRDVLGCDATAAYLFGSAVLSGLKSESDPDLFAMSGQRTTQHEKQHFVDCLLTISGRPTPREWWRCVASTLVVERDIKPWRYPPSFDFQYVDWLRSEFEMGNVESWRKKTSPYLDC